MDAIPDTKRAIKALQIIANGNIRAGCERLRYIVQSQTKKETFYTVDLSRSQASCTCPDHTMRHKKCKHIRAVETRRILLRDIQQYLSQRDDITLDTVVKTAQQHTKKMLNDVILNLAEELRYWEKKAIATIAAEMQKQTAQKQTAAQRPAFQIRYWWPGVDGERALDVVTLPSLAHKVERLEVKRKNESAFRRTAYTITDIVTYMEEHDMQPGKVELKRNKKRGSSWMGQFVVPIITRGEQQ